MVTGHTLPQSTVSRDVVPRLPAGKTLDTLWFVSRIHIRRRACASDLRQGPGAVVPHAGICAGGAGQPASLPRPIDNAPMN